jgi:hypothetical protein
MRLKSPKFPATLCRSWFRLCATSQKVVSSISDCVNGIFKYRISSGRTISLGSTQILPEMSIRNPFRGWSYPMHRTGKLTNFICREVWIWQPQLPGTISTCPFLHRDSFTFAIFRIPVANPCFSYVEILSSTKKKYLDN